MVNMVVSCSCTCTHRSARIDPSQPQREVPQMWLRSGCAAGTELTQSRNEGEGQSCLPPCEGVRCAADSRGAVPPAMRVRISDGGGGRQHHASGSPPSRCVHSVLCTTANSAS